MIFLKRWGPMVWYYIYTIDLVDPPISKQSAPPCAMVSLGLMLLNGSQLEENKMVPCFDSFLFFHFSVFLVFGLLTKIT